MNALRTTTTIALLLLSACADSAPAPEHKPPAEGSMMPVDAFEACERGTLEDDLSAPPLSGRGVHDGALAKGQYVFATTYLQLQVDKRGRLNELVGPVVSDLVPREGLIAMTLGTSSSCNTARTLTVWRDEEAMLEFVVGPAHGRVMQASSELSRGGSLGTHWAGDETAASWESAADHLAEEDQEGF